MQEELRRRFRDRFIDTARGRVRKSVGLLADEDGATPLMTELHSLAGEAALLGLKDISNAAREGELAARDWVEGDTSAKLRCVRLVRKVSQCVEAFAAEPVAPEPGGSAEGSPSERNRRILVIDDSTLSGEHIADSLGDHGLETRLATEPRTALAAVETFRPRLVISDVNMPGVHLAELCGKLRAASTESLLVMLLSGMAEDALASTARQVGADGYISKQHGMDRVVDRVLELLEGTNT